jgi:hypothetical protein
VTYQQQQELLKAQQQAAAADAAMAEQMDLVMQVSAQLQCTLQCGVRFLAGCSCTVNYIYKHVLQALELGVKPQTGSASQVVAVISIR